MELAAWSKLLRGLSALDGLALGLGLGLVLLGLRLLLGLLLGGLLGGLLLQLLLLLGQLLLLLLRLEAQPASALYSFSSRLMAARSLISVASCPGTICVQS